MDCIPLQVAYSIIFAFVHVGFEPYLIHSGMITHHFVREPGGRTQAGILYKSFGIPNGIWNLALESGIRRLKEILQVQEISGYLRILL